MHSMFQQLNAIHTYMYETCTYTHPAFIIPCDHKCSSLPCISPMTSHAVFSPVLYLIVSFFSLRNKYPSHNCWYKAFRKPSCEARWVSSLTLTTPTRELIPQEKAPCLIASIQAHNRYLVSVKLENGCA